MDGREENCQMVAPVLKEDATSRTIKFPVGTWLGDDGSTVTGPKTIEVNAPINRLPHYRLRTGR